MHKWRSIVYTPENHGGTKNTNEMAVAKKSTRDSKCIFSMKTQHQPLKPLCKAREAQPTEKLPREREAGGGEGVPV